MCLRGEPISVCVAGGGGKKTPTPFSICCYFLSQGFGFRLFVQKMEERDGIWGWGLDRGGAGVKQQQAGRQAGRQHSVVKHACKP